VKPMPTYEYHCTKCEKDFEVFQSMKDEAFKTCPEAQCQMSPWGHGKVKRLLGTGAGLIFKGSGFYTTDYRSEGYKQAAKKESSSGSEKKAADKPAAGSSGSSTSPTPKPSSGGSSPPAGKSSGAS
jgi:putative FmdB family regulatory protein